MNSFDVLVTGAGPAGLFAAIAAAGEAGTPGGGAGTAWSRRGIRPGGLKVAVLEKNASPGKKLLISGSGKCNLTHREPVEGFLSRYGGDMNSPGKSPKARFVRPALYLFPPERLEGFFTDRGVPLMATPEGKVFPRSENSREILEVLLGELDRLGVELICGVPVEKITKEGGIFAAVSGGSAGVPRKVFRAPRLILAAGGRSFPKTGSDGGGGRLAASLGHSLVEFRPMAAPVEIRDFPLSDLAGVSLPAGLTLFRENKKLGEARGDLLVTHRGFSGPVIQNNCRYMRPGDCLGINFPDRSREVLEEEILRASGQAGRILAKTFFQGLGLPERLVLALLEAAGVPRERRLSELPRADRRNLLDLVCGWRGIIAGIGGWDTAKVTAGGVALEEVNSGTMESRLVPGLFFAGEVLDVDGDTGGYNLQFAFSSGYMAGIHAAEVD